MNKLPVVLGHQVEQQVAFVGPFGVGKTTALRAISDIPVVNTDVASAEAARPLAQEQSGKTTTTVGLDYGEWRFPDGKVVALIGVPGQDRFDAMWDALLPRSSAIVLWIYGDRDPTRLECRKWLQALAQRKAVARLAVAVTRVSAGQEQQVLDSVRELVARFHPLAPVLSADPREPADVLQAVTMALVTPYTALQA